jgi:protein-L-isoaspartate(D-aspartate) O-methyltransferase
MDFAARERERMVVEDIQQRGIEDENVVNSMKSVPRHEFVDEEISREAYQDQPLPIGSDQTISQPYIVALMIEAAQLKPEDRVLEIGTGSGYSAAVMANIVNEVYTIESVPELAEKATATLQRLSYENVHVRHGDGTLGWPEEAPFNAIIVTAAAPRYPESLKAQLAYGGRMVIPVANGLLGETLMCVTKLADNEFVEEALADVRFVPLLGREGYGEEEPWPGDTTLIYYLL